MKWISIVLVSALFVQLGYVPCAADEAGIKVNSRVRVRLRAFPGRQLEGTVVKANASTFWLSVDGQSPVAVPLASLKGLDVVGGQRRNAGKGAILGLLIGGSLGVLAGASEEDDPPGIMSFSKEDRMALAGVSLGLAGLAIGTVVGALTKSDVWKPAPLKHINLGLSPQRQGGLVMSAKVAF